MRDCDPAHVRLSAVLTTVSKYRHLHIRSIFSISRHACCKWHNRNACKSTEGLILFEQTASSVKHRPRFLPNPEWQW
ncbi:unnamed protein product [Rhodiola kirilowii]